LLGEEVTAGHALDVFFLDPCLLPVEAEVDIEGAACMAVANEIAHAKGLNEERREATRFAIKRLLAVLGTTMTQADALQRVRLTFLAKNEESTT